ncbi:hypothetical protein Y032_0070g449 [Ancylostoma ceylanicum]|nr:hypothetical protein Y032_0070g449 [Ancylostoma ceylanicum]
MQQRLPSFPLNPNAAAFVPRGYQRQHLGEDAEPLLQAGRVAGPARSKTSQRLRIRTILTAFIRSAIVIKTRRW